MSFDEASPAKGTERPEAAEAQEQDVNKNAEKKVDEERKRAQDQVDREKNAVPGSVEKPDPRLEKLMDAAKLSKEQRELLQRICMSEEDLPAPDFSGTSEKLKKLYEPDEGIAICRLPVDIRAIAERSMNGGEPNEKDVETIAKLLKMYADGAAQVKEYRDLYKQESDKKFDSIAKELNISKECLVKGFTTVLAPPKGASEQLVQQYKRIAETQATLRPRYDAYAAKPSEAERKTIADAFQDFEKSLDEYEISCRMLVLPQLQSVLMRNVQVNLPTGAEKLAGFDLERLIQDIGTPISEAPARAQPPQTEAHVQYLQKQKIYLEQSRAYALNGEGGIQDMLKALRAGQKLSPEDCKNTLARMVLFLHERDEYESIVRNKPKEEHWYDKFLHFYIFAGGLEVNHMFWDGVRAQEKAGKKPEKPKDLPVPSKTEKLFTEAQETLRQRLVEKGVPEWRIQQFEKNLYAAGGFEGVNFRSLKMEFLDGMTHLNAIDALLFAYMVHSSENKTKAAIDFGLMLVGGSGASTMLAAVERVFAKQAINAALTRNFVMAKRFTWLARVPGHPVVKFALIVAILAGASEPLEQLGTWIDSQIPDSFVKEKIGDGLHFISGGPIFDAFDSADMGFGGMGRSDKDKASLKFLQQKAMAGSLERRLFHSPNEWNANLDAQIAHLRAKAKAEGRPEPEMLIKFYELEKIDQNKMTMWAADAFRDTVALQDREDMFMGDLKKVGINVPAPGLASFVTNPAVPHDDVNTVDVQLSWYLAGTGQYGGYNISAIGTAIDGLTQENMKDLLKDVPEDKRAQKFKEKKEGLQKSWKALKSQATDLAKDIAVYRNLGIYDHKKWFGDAENITDPTKRKMTDHVRDGHIERLAYELKRQQVVQVLGQKDMESYSQGLLRQALNPDPRDLAPTTIGVMKKMVDISSHINRIIHPGEHEHKEWNKGAVINLLIEMHGMLQTAQQLLPKAGTDPDQAAQMEEIIGPVQRLVLRTDDKIPDEADVRAARDHMARQIVALREKMIPEKPLAEADYQDRGQLGVGPDTQLFLVDPGQTIKETRTDKLGRRMASLPGWAANIVGQNNRALEKARVDQLPNVMLEKFVANAPYQDIQLFDTGESETHASNWIKMTSFDCSAPDRKNWHVKIQNAYARQVGRDGMQYKPGDTINVSFEEWCKNSPVHAKQLEEAFNTAEQKHNDRRGKEREAAAKEKAEYEASLEKKNIPEGRLRMNNRGQYRMRIRKDDGSEAYIAIKPENRGATIGAAYVNGMRAPSTPFTFEDDTHHWSIPNGNFASAPNTGLDNAYFRDVLTSPIEGQDAESIWKILNIFSHEEKDWGNGKGLSSVNELYNDIVSLYGQMPGYHNKRVFLNELYMQLSQKKAITFANKGEIVKRLQDVVRDSMNSYYPSEDDLQTIGATINDPLYIGPRREQLTIPRKNGIVYLRLPPPNTWKWGKFGPDGKIEKKDDGTDQTYGTNPDGKCSIQAPGTYAFWRPGEGHFQVQIV